MFVARNNKKEKRKKEKKKRKRKKKERKEKEKKEEKSFINANLNFQALFAGGPRTKTCFLSIIRLPATPELESTYRYYTIERVHI